MISYGDEEYPTNSETKKFDERKLFLVVIRSPRPTKHKTYRLSFQHRIW